MHGKRWRMIRAAGRAPRLVRMPKASRRAASSGAGAGAVQPGSDGSALPAVESDARVGGQLGLALGRV